MSILVPTSTSGVIQDQVIEVDDPTDDPIAILEIEPPPQRVVYTMCTLYVAYSVSMLIAMTVVGSGWIGIVSLLITCNIIVEVQIKPILRRKGEADPILCSICVLLLVVSYLLCHAGTMGSTIPTDKIDGLVAGALLHGLFTAALVKLY